MGDRAVVVFAEGGHDHVAVYRHWGGSGIEGSLKDFFDAEVANPQHDNRFGDPEYLAARFLVWSSDSRGTGVGIVPVDRHETTKVRVHCDNDRRPRIEVLEPADDPRESLRSREPRVFRSDSAEPPPDVHSLRWLDRTDADQWEFLRRVPSGWLWVPSLDAENMFGVSGNPWRYATGHACRGRYEEVPS